MNGLAARLRCTEGQLYTAAIGLALAVALLLIGIPPVLRDQLVAAAPTAAPAVPTTTTAVATTTTTTTTAAAPPGRRPTLALGPTTSTSTSARPAAPPTVPPLAPAPVVPLSIIAAGYTSASGGTPLAGPEVPDDGMPVGVALGQVDKASFARLAGTGTVLRLAPVDDPAAHRLVALAAVRACVITDVDWSLAEPGAPPDDAPSYDAARCVDGTQDPDGTWAFDLAELGEFDVGVGIALIPVVEGPATFQVTFSDVAVADRR